MGTFVVDVDSTLMTDPVGDLDLGQAVFQVVVQRPSPILNNGIQ